MTRKRVDWVCLWLGVLAVVAGCGITIYREVRLPGHGGIPKPKTFHTFLPEGSDFSKEPGKFEEEVPLKELLESSVTSPKVNVAWFNFNRKLYVIYRILVIGGGSKQTTLVFDPEFPPYVDIDWNASRDSITARPHRHLVNPLDVFIGGMMSLCAGLIVFTVGSTLARKLIKAS